MDLFEREQRIYDEAVGHLKEIENGPPCDRDKFSALALEYGRLLRQFRSVTKMHDRITIELNKSKLDLLSKVNYDVLTGVWNRRYMEENLRRVLRSLARSDGTLSVMMMDIDGFKRLNDTYGHHIGDVCICSVAEILHGCMKRADDFVARYGGDEFVVVLPGTDREGACAIAERLLENVRKLKIPHSDGGYDVTVSLGATTGDVTRCHKTEDYIKRADKAMYVSKQKGGDRCTHLEFEEG